MKPIIYVSTLLGFLLGNLVYGAAPQAIDQEIINGESGVYILYDDGTIQTAGQAVSFGSPGNIDAVDLNLTSSLKGYYVLDSEGRVHSFGDAVIINRPLNSENDYVDMEPSPLGDGFYFLREDGHITTAGRAVFYGERNREAAIDLELTLDGQGYYVLYQDGTLDIFGTAVNYGFTQTSNMHAVDLELGQEGYYVLYDDGTLLQFGDAVVLPSLSAPEAKVSDMTLTDRGYRILLVNGEEQVFHQLKNQGTLNWFAQAEPKQVNPTPTPTNTPTPTPTPSAETNYLNIRLDDFAERVIGRLPENVNIPPSLTTGQLSLPNGDTYLAVATEDTEKARQIRLFEEENFGDFDNEGTLFAGLVPERGAASIRGISYSSLGMVVTIDDEPRPLLLLIEGPFDPSAASGFILH